jgi:hypothetical protein
MIGEIPAAQSSRQPGRTCCRAGWPLECAGSGRPRAGDSKDTRTSAHQDSGVVEMVAGRKSRIDFVRNAIGIYSREGFEMWEDGRPDWLPPGPKKRLEWGVPMLAGIGITLSFLALISGTGIRNWATHAPQEAISPEVLPHSVSRPSPRQTTTSPHRSEPARQPLQGATSPQYWHPAVPSGDRAVLRKLIETCQYWTNSDVGGRHAGHRTVACNEMRTYASRHGYELSGSGPATPALQVQVPTPSYQIPIYVNQCSGYGSIRYRDCRSREKKRLEKLCGAFRERLELASGSDRDRLRRSATAACTEADRYAVVN